MMKTYTAPTLPNLPTLKCLDRDIRMCKCTDDFTESSIRSSAGHSGIRGFTLTELIVVLVIIWLFVLLAVMNLSGALRRNTFKVQAHEFVSTMQMAVNAAAESDRRYEVIIDITEQYYMLRQITTPDLWEVLEEEIIVNNYFGDSCRVWYVEFDDGDYTDPEHMRARFRAGHSGWAYGGKIVLVDEDERAYSVVINRINRVVKLKNGDVEVPIPKAKKDVYF
ncbi:MAG: pilus assembly FimT family protein [Planctomycetota bacterium]